MPDVERQLWRGAAARVVGVFAIRALAFVKMVVFARIFFPDDLGVAWLCLSIVGFLSCLGDLGVHYTIIRAPADRLREIIGASLILALLCVVTIAVAGWLAAPLLARLFNQNMADLIRFSLLLLLGIPLAVPRAVLERDMDFQSYPISQALLEAASLAATVTVQFTGLAQGTYALLIGQLAGVMAAGGFLFGRTGWLLKRGITGGGYRDILRFGLPYILHSTGGFLSQQADKFLLGISVTAHDLAVYNTMWALPQIISAIISSIDGMLYPLYVRVKDDQEKLRRLFDATCKAWSVVGVAMGMPLVLFAEEIIRLVFGGAWVGGALALKILAVSYIVRFSTGYAYDNLVALRAKGRYMAVWSVVTVLLILTVGAWMISRYGILGAAMFWLLQAVVLIPLVRFPIILSEFGNLGFAVHVWQPVFSGLTAVVVVVLFDPYLGHDGAGWLLLKLTGFLLVYFTVLMAIDRDVRRFLRGWMTGAKRGPAW